MPVLAIDGSRGFPGGPSKAMRLVADDVTNVTIEGSGHYPAEEQPEALATAMMQFFSQRTDPSR